MIVYDLICGQGHRFEAWFGSADNFTSQQQRGLVSCPLCDDRHIEKAVMAPAIGAKSNQSDDRNHDRPPTAQLRAQLGEQLRKLRAEVEASCDYVGDRFAEEARRRHEEGDTERGIFGQASIEAAKDLIDDGIPVAPLPFRPRQTSDA